jgi:AcrR family transcriptional regulator
MLVSPAMDGHPENGNKVDGRTAAAARRRAETHARILDAATTAFADAGYHNTSVDDIIGRAGVARGTFYLYFESKRSVLSAVLADILGGIELAVQAIRLEQPETPYEQLVTNLERAWKVFADDPRRAQIVLAGLHGLDPDFDVQVSALEAFVLSMIGRSIRKGQELGWLRPFDPRMGACALVGAFKENLIDELLRKDAPRAGAERMTALLEVLLLGSALGPLRVEGRG